MTSIALRSADLAAGYSVHLMIEGNQVAGQVTLDNCGYRFTTEAYRVARRQFLVENSASQDIGLSNELVAYDTSAHAAMAVAQWHAAAATCPHTAVKSTVAGEPDLTVKIVRNDVDVAVLPAKTNTVTVESLQDKDKHKFYNVSILQVRGRYLDAVYLTTNSPITATQTAAAQRVAVITGRRLVALR